MDTHCDKNTVGTEHCFHDFGVAVLTAPPKTKQRCCWCGVISARSIEAVVPEGHGCFCNER